MSNTLNQKFNSILDEYVMVTNAIANIQKKINMYKKSIEEKIEFSADNNEINMYVKEYKLFISGIKNDSDIIERYRKLKNKQKELYEQLFLYSKTHYELESTIISEPILKSSPILTPDVNEANDNDGIEKIINNLKFKYVEKQLPQ